MLGMQQMKDRLLEDKDRKIQFKEREVGILQESWRIHPRDLRLDEFLAEGGEGRVYRGRWRGNIQVAIKLMLRDPKRPNDHGFSNKELKAMQRLRGSHLVHFFGLGQLVLIEEETDDDDGGGGDSVVPQASTDAVATAPQVRRVQPSDKDVWDFVVIEYMPGGSLRDLLLSKDVATWEWTERLRVLCDVATGVAQMHDAGYVHRDLKPENILVTETGMCKISDLGLSRSDTSFNVKQIDSLEKRLSDRTEIAWSSVGGTPPYMAPDVVTEYISQHNLSGFSSLESVRQVLTEIPHDGAGSSESMRSRSRSRRSVDYNEPPPIPNADTAVVRQSWVSVVEVSQDDIVVAESLGRTKRQTPDYIAAVAAAASREEKETGGSRRQRRSSGSSSRARLLNSWHAPDAYAYGVIMWEVLTLRIPWSEHGGFGMRSFKKMWTKVRRGERPKVHKDEVRRAPEKFMHLLNRMWAQNPVARPTFDEALRHLQGMLDRLPPVSHRPLPPAQDSMALPPAQESMGLSVIIAGDSGEDDTSDGSGEEKQSAPLRSPPRTQAAGAAAVAPAQPKSPLDKTLDLVSDMFSGFFNDG